MRAAAAGAMIEGALTDWISQLSADRYDTSMNFGGSIGLIGSNPLDR
jgi:hypothetical protein